MNHRPDAASLPDLSNCAREPIHIPGAIQPHGCLIALDADSLTVDQVSANLESLLGIAPASLHGRPFPEVLAPAQAELLRAALAVESSADVDPLHMNLAGTAFDVAVHRGGAGVVILEFEPTPAATAPRIGLDHVLRDLSRAVSYDALIDATARSVRALTGFDRVMVYRFDDDGHGEVVSESRVDELEPYLGLHYPESDIPAQARALYLRKWVRCIPDARYAPVAVVPALHPRTGKPLDLGDSLLRSVSPVHLEYMANMGVRASMSVSLIVAGRLWGLISAGHREPHALPLALRSACETIGRTVSLQIGAFEALDFRRRQDDNVDALGRLVAGMQRATGDVLEGLANEPAALLEIAGAAGAAIVFDDRVARVGACPPESVVVDLARWIGERTLADGTFATHALSADDARWAPWAVDVSGVIAIALPSAAQRCVIWFRPEQAHTVNWGGNPDKAGSVDDAAGTPRMHPRRSFELWKEVVQGRSARWDPAELHAARTLRRYAVEVDLDRQIAKERAAVQARDELVAVLSHDLRTPMSVVVMQAAMIQRLVLDDPSQTMQRFRVAAATIQRAGGRMNALLNDLLDLSKIEAGRFSVAAGPYGARQLVAEACELMGTLAISSNIVLEQEATEDIVVKADPERIFQVFSNLIGNAIKHAAHSGQVRVGAVRVLGMCEFQVSDDGDGIAPEHIDNIFERYWQGNPSDSAGAGLGLYIAKGIVEAHGGTLRARSRPGAGTTFAFTLPVDRSDPPS